VPLDKDYSFESEHGPKSLVELFDGRSQPVVYHFMFGPHYDGGCPACSFDRGRVRGGRFLTSRPAT
jgi:predicted dithiol-disulfide oxidoreductase (DUF899 family)